MNCRPLPICLLIAAAAAVIPVCLTYAEGPQLIPRAMVVWGHESLTWDQQGSVALLATGNSGASDTQVIGAQLTPTAIKDTLLQNRPDLSNEQISGLAEYLIASLVGATCVAEDGRVKHVATGGVKHPLVYFSSNDDLLTTGAMAEAGPDGNVVVLGEFLLRKKTPADEGFPYYLTGVSNDTWLILGPDQLSSTEARVQIAVGWFTR